MPNAEAIDSTKHDSVVRRRRDFLAMTAGAIAAKTVLPAVARSEAASQVEALVRKYDAAHAAMDNADRDNDAADRLTQRWGDPFKLKVSHRVHWGHDPDFAVYLAAGDEAERLDDIRREALDELMACPARSLADVRRKLDIVCMQWRHLEADREDCCGREVMTMDFLKEAGKIFTRSGIESARSLETLRGIA